MQRDLRETELYREAEALYRAVRQPGTGQISDATEIHVSSNGRQAVFSGAILDALEGLPPTRVCQVDLITGAVRVLTFGPHSDRLPKYSPDGQQVAFLSDRHQAGDFQLYVLNPDSGAVRTTPRVEGWVEYLHWSPDGARVLLGVAGHGADVAGGQGAVASKQVAEKLPSWTPTVETGEESHRWRRAWVYELATHKVRQVSAADTNIWEVVWCGNDALAAVISPGPGEGLWYSARLARIELNSGTSHDLYHPKDQLGWSASSPSGRHVAIVEALCSDRGIVAGELRLIDTASGTVQKVDTRGVDIAYAEWRSETRLLLGGHRGFDTVVGLFDAVTRTFTEIWASRDVTTSGWYVTVSGLNDCGDCALIGESFVRAPEIAVIRQGEYRSVKSFNLGYAEYAKLIRSVESLTWKAPDGLEIQGLLLRPEGAGPFALVMHIHGGPVWQSRPVWLGRKSVQYLMLLQRGYAIFFPNPRGSSGRGQDFARRVVGDMGGADTYDYLSGVDALVERGIADPKRLAVTGGSYGGFMTSWLVTQDSRFAAALPLAPTTNQVTQHLISNIPHFVASFLADRYDNPGGKYFSRSPIMHAHKVRAPTLNIAGALDRCTPPEEAVQFHNALLENGVESMLVIYPEEGHGIRKLPAVIDYGARLVAWFEKHLKPKRTGSNSSAS